MVIVLPELLPHCPLETGLLQLDAAEAHGDGAASVRAACISALSAEVAPRPDAIVSPRLTADQLSE